MRHTSGPCDSQRPMQRAYDTANILLARILLVVALSFPTTLARADEAAEQATQTLDPHCAQRDLAFFAAIEQNGNRNRMSTDRLVNAASHLQVARAACAAGDVAKALAIYDAEILRLNEYARMSR